MFTAGGRIRCLQCAAKGKRSGVQCRAVAIKGKTKCRNHGGLSSGPQTESGRQRCAEAKTIHGRETRKARSERSHGLQRLAQIEAVGRALGLIVGPKSRGRKPG